MTSPRILDVGLENLHLAPKDCATALYWELDHEDEDLDPFFQKEEWFSSTLLEWGRCGKLTVEEETALGFAQYAPATLFARLPHFPAGQASLDAAYLAYCFVVEGRRGHGVGGDLIRDVARDVVERGYLALEAIGDRSWDGGWVLPHDFLSAVGFRVLRDDPRFPLMRLELRTAVEPEAAEARASVAVPASVPAPGLA